MRLFSSTGRGRQAGLPAYPRPQLRRDEWISLNGEWEFAIDPEARWSLPDEVSWDDTINVPFAPETEASGIGDSGLYRACWYRRTFKTPDLGEAVPASRK